MTIQIAGARRAAAAKPEASSEALEAAEHTGRQVLSELDSMLSVLRATDESLEAASFQGPGYPAAGGNGNANGNGNGVGHDGNGLARTPLPRLTDIPGLAERLREAGRTVTFTVVGDPPHVPASVQVVVYRVVQEALTNAVRYAGDAPIDVQLLYTPDAITVFVDDDGPGAAATARPGGGHGLVGMSERLATVGGSLSAGPRTPGPGWRVHATVPVLALVS
jgi:hypothetical protein